MTQFDQTAYDVSRDPLYAELKRHIVEMTGLAYYLDKDIELASHIEHRLETRQISECGSYLEMLLGQSSGPAELDALIASLTNGETFFFRHQELFDALAGQVIPELIDRNRSRRQLRIWSAGCANGAEPYSLSILLEREFGPQLVGWDITIVGTDINRDFLLQGERGEFSEWSLRSIGDDLQASCFRRSDQIWTIDDAYRRGVQFRYHNLVQHPFPALIDEPSAFDLILCRNVMIYFAPPIIRRLVGQFHDCLVPGGWFAVGPAEPNVDLFRAFETVNAAGAVLYRRRQRPAVANTASSQAAPAGALPATPLVEPGPRLRARLPRDQAQLSAMAHCRSMLAPAAARREPASTFQQTLANAQLKLNLGQSEAAADCCQRLMAAERLNPLVHFYDALVAEHRGRHGETERALRRAIYLDRDFVLAHYHLGLVLLRKQDVRGAQRSFRNVLALLERREAAEMFPDADGLTVGALRDLTDMQLEVLQCT
ncbi:MAG TPA: protein-glutamate O-methyltransferase CheR [Pirellulales bacterium]